MWHKWQVSIEDELNTDFRGLRPSAASHEESSASLANDSQLDPHALHAPPDLQNAALALHWALISLAGAHRRAAGPAAPALSADADLAHGQPMTHLHPGPRPAAEPLAGAAGVTSGQLLALHPHDAHLGAGNARDATAAAAVADSDSQESDAALPAPQAGLLCTVLPAWPDETLINVSIENPGHQSAMRLQSAHLMQESIGGGIEYSDKSAAAPVSEPGSVDHAAEEAVVDAAADTATGDPVPPDAENGDLDSSISCAADEAFSLAYVILGNAASPLQCLSACCSFCVRFCIVPLAKNQFPPHGPLSMHEGRLCLPELPNKSLLGCFTTSD